MQKVVRVQRHHFTIVGNEMLRNKKMSYKAKGLLCYLLSHADGWYISLKKLEYLSFEGIRAVRSGLNELVSGGYVKKCEIRNKSGKFDVEYFVSEFPEDLTACRYGMRFNRMPLCDADNGMRSSYYKNTIIRKTNQEKSSSVESIKNRIEKYGINEVMTKDVEDVINDDDDLEFFFEMIKRIDDEIERGSVKRITPYVIASLCNFIVEVKSEVYLKEKEEKQAEREAKERKSVERRAKEREVEECQEFYDGLREADKEILIDEAIEMLDEVEMEKFKMFESGWGRNLGNLPGYLKRPIIVNRNEIITRQMEGVV